MLILAGRAPHARARVGPAAAPALAADGPQLTVKVATLNLRQGPGTNYPVVGKLTQGAQAAIIGRNAAGDWYQVRPAGGSTGWVTGAPALVQVTGDLTAVPVVSAPVPAAQPAGKSAGTIVLQTASGGPIYATNADGSNLRYLTTGIDPALYPMGERWPSRAGPAPAAFPARCGPSVSTARASDRLRET